MEREKIIDRVRKLFSLASNNPSLEEAGSAMMAAQAMLARYSIDLIDLAENEDGTGLVEELVVATSINNFFYWQKSLAAVIAKNFRCSWYTSKNPKLISDGQYHYGATINFIGLSADMGIAEEVFKQAYAICNVFSNIHADEEIQRFLCKHGWKPTATVVKKIKNDWRLGFVRGLSKQFEKQVAQNNWAMILKLPPGIELYKKTIDLKSAPYVEHAPRNITAYESGKAYGKQVAGQYEEHPAVGPKLLGPKE